MHLIAWTKNNVGTPTPRRRWGWTERPRTGLRGTLGWRGGALPALESGRAAALRMGVAATPRRAVTVSIHDKSEGDPGGGWACA